MTTYVAALGSITLTANEQATVQAAVGYEDAQGMLSAINASIQESILQLQRIAAYIPGGTNATAIGNAITTLQS